MGLVRCFECDCDLTPNNFHEVEKIKTGEIVTLCNQHYNEFVKSGRLEHIDDDGNYTCGNMHIFKGTNTEKGVWEHPCYECNSLTYLGKLIPTVSWMSADYYGISFQCHNPWCDPIYEKYEDDETGKVSYDLIDSGAYWDGEDKHYYTPNNPRM